MNTVRRSLLKPKQFTDFVRLEIHGDRCKFHSTSLQLPRGIYQLYLPKFGILYLGISGVDGHGISKRMRSHAQKITGRFAGAADTKAFAQFRSEATEHGYDLDTILDKILVFTIPCDNMTRTEIEAWETVIYNALRSRGQCQFNSAKRIEGLDLETLNYVLNQEYLLDTARYYI